MPSVAVYRCFPARKVLSHWALSKKICAPHSVNYQKSFPYPGSTLWTLFEDTSPAGKMILGTVRILECSFQAVCECFHLDHCQKTIIQYWHGVLNTVKSVFPSLEELSVHCQKNHSHLEMSSLPCKSPHQQWRSLVRILSGSAGEIYQFAGTVIRYTAIASCILRCEKSLPQTSEYVFTLPEEFFPAGTLSQRSSSRLEYYFLTLSEEVLPTANLILYSVRRVLQSRSVVSVRCSEEFYPAGTLIL